MTNSALREVTILLADLRGFTSTTAAYPPHVVIEVLNSFLATMTELIVDAGGHVDKFMGDSIMAVFGTPGPQPDHAARAVTCAARMQLAMVALNERARKRDLPELYMGIGINSGMVLAGPIGSKLFSQDTVIGEEVNLAARIESFSLRGQILVSHGTFARCDGLALTASPMDVLVKGRREPISVYEVVGIPALGLEVPRQEARRSPRVDVTMPFRFNVLTEKIVLPNARGGTILDIGYHGILAEIDPPLPPRSDIRLDIDLPILGRQATDIYAKAVKDITRLERALTGIEFTSVSSRGEADIRHFVQLLMQGSELR